MRTMITLSYIRKTLVTACCALLIGGCNNRESIIGQESDLPINFTATGDNIGNPFVTRLTPPADDGGVNFEVGDQIGVFAYYTPKDETSQSTYFINQKVACDGSSSSSWSYAPPRYWPTEGDLKFYGYFPYVADLSTPEVSYSGIRTDVLWADNLTAKKDEPVELYFRHVLACVRLNVSWQDGMSVTSMDISMNDKKSGLPAADGSLTLNIKTGGITASAQSGSIVFPFPAITGNSLLSENIFIPPYSGLETEQLTLVCAFEVGGESQNLTCTLPLPKNKAFEQGKLYRYNLELGEDFTITDITIGEFQQGETTDVVKDRDFYVGHENTYYVGTAKYLLKISNEISENRNYINRKIILVDDIDLSGVKWEPIGETRTTDGDPTGYGGIFEGNNYKIKGLRVEKPANTGNLWEDDYGRSKYESAGLISYLRPEGVVRNVILEDGVNIDVRAQETSTDLHVGCIAGITDGRIENCHVRGDVTIIGKTLEGLTIEHTSDGRLGGITGMLVDDGKVIGCSISGNLTVRTEGFSYIRSGGLVGYSVAKEGGTDNTEVIGCYINGHYEITGKSESVFAKEMGTNSYNAPAAQVTLGGLVGYSSGVKVIGCYIKGDENSKIEIEPMGDNLTYDMKGWGAVSANNLASGEANAVYWVSTDKVNKAYEENTGTNAGIKKITDGSWSAAITDMNTALNGECNWKYIEGSDGAPVLVPNN